MTPSTRTKSTRTKQSVVSVSSVEDIQSILASGSSVQIVGGGTKNTLSNPRAASTVLDMTPLSGILAYDPGEYTFTALAGTRLSDVQAELAEHGQYLPFEPPLADQGATLGGTIAAGISGSGRQRYGGVRDFLIGVRFVDGLGRLVRGGGYVVKNAAGFDLPKLMVGSLGQLGVLTEVSFKVFPQPPAYATLCLDQPSVASALEMLARLSTLPVDIDALDITVTDSFGTDSGATVWLRIGGLASTLEPRLDGLAGCVGQGERFLDAEERQLWQAAGAFDWAGDQDALVKIPLSPTGLLDFDRLIDGRGVRRRYIAGGHLVWLSWPGAVDELDALLGDAGRAGLVLIGESDRPLIGSWSGMEFYRRLKQTLDPDSLLPNYII